MSAEKLAGRVAVVTGASEGIGAAIAVHLADASGPEDIRRRFSEATTAFGRLDGRVIGAGVRIVLAVEIRQPPVLIQRS